MSSEIGRWRALANAGFVLAILVVSGFGMVQVASREWWVQKTFHVRAALSTIGGLEAGNQVRVQGIFVGSREMFEAMNRAVSMHKMRPIVDRVFPFEQAREAFRYMESAAHFGKIALRV